MNPKLTEDQRRALQNQSEGVRVVDDQTHKLYVLVDEDLHRRAMDALHQQEDIAAIQAGVDAAAAGRVATLDEADARIRKKLGFPART
jgi:predicted transcriptional regulator